MAHLILPSRRIVQPPGAVEVDWSNPLTRGLVVAFLPDSIQPINLVNKVRLSQSYSDDSTVNVDPVRCLYIPGSGGVNRALILPTAGLNSRSFTVAGRIKTHSVTGVGVCMRDSSNTIPLWRNAGFDLRIGGTDYTAAGAYNLGQWYDYAAASGQSGVNVCVDGASVLSGAAGGNVTLGDMSYAVDPIGGGSHNISTQWLGVWRRALDAQEVGSLCANPWQIFRPVTRRIYFDVGAGAPAGAVLEGAATGAASASGALTTGIPIAGAALSVATASGSLAVGIPLAGAAASLSDASGSLTAQITLAGSALAQAVSSALLSTGIVMTADAVAQAAADGTLETAIQLLGSAQAQADATGDLTTASGGLEGHAQASASAAASLTAAIRLEAAALAEAIATGNLAGASANLAGSAVAVASADGALTVNVALTAQALASAIAQGSLTTEIRLAADAAAAAQAGAQLSGGSTFVIPAARSGVRVLQTSSRRGALSTGVRRNN